MAEYRHSGHAMCDNKYPLVSITKHRDNILRGEMAERSRHLIGQICHALGVVIVQGSLALAAPGSGMKMFKNLR